MAVLATVDWIGAVASVVVAVLALAGIAVYLLQRQDQRLQFGPILRVDIGPNEVVGDWQPPAVNRARDFALEFASATKPGTAFREVYVWLRNTQDAPAGVAWDIRLFIELDLSPDDAEDWESIGPIRVVYLEAHTTMRIRVLRISEAFNHFTVRLSALSYRGRLMRLQRDTHGRLDCQFHEQTYAMRPRIMGESLRRPWRWFRRAWRWSSGLRNRNGESSDA